MYVVRGTNFKRLKMPPKRLQKTTLKANFPYCSVVTIYMELLPIWDCIV